MEVSGVKFWCYNAGHVLGAAMFMIEIAGVKVSCLLPGNSSVRCLDSDFKMFITINIWIYLYIYLRIYSLKIICFIRYYNDQDIPHLNRTALKIIHHRNCYLLNAL